ncbi:hypothetical protein LPJ72_005835 [Coemansia sp. Benny D160-2]|nr:hypothetical protein LPJ72_005835 [Coemansia sp. Benny D160-2]
MAGVRRQLGLQGIEKRAEFVFVESSKKIMETGTEWVFGRRSNARLAALMAFDQLCSRGTGVNPNTLVCSAVSMGLEHLYASAPHTSEGMLKRSRRKQSQWQRY